MPKAYLVSVYQSIADPEKVAAYAKLAAPAVVAAGGRALARGVAAEAYESGVKERVVLVEFDSLDQARALYHSAEYEKAREKLGAGAVRDMRIVEGL
jgi:uncharacterized protein (DUF1330 family)